MKLAVTECLDSPKTTASSNREGFGKGICRVIAEGEILYVLFVFWRGGKMEGFLQRK